MMTWRHPHLPPVYHWQSPLSSRPDRWQPTPMVWRAVCTRPGNVFTVAFWSTIT